MDGRPIWTDCDEAGDYVVPNVLSPRDLVSRPDNMDETVPHIDHITITGLCNKLQFSLQNDTFLDEILQYFFLFMLETQIVGTPHLRVTTLYVYNVTIWYLLTYGRVSSWFCFYLKFGMVAVRQFKQS